MLGLFRRRKPPQKEAGGATQNEVMREVARLCHMLDDRELIHAIYAAVEGREMFRDDLLILRMRLDFLYRRRFNKAVQEDIDPV